MQQLWKVAHKDGVITPEEYDILEQVRIDADAYHVMLQECLEDGTISKEEAEQLHKLKARKTVLFFCMALFTPRYA